MLSSKLPPRRQVSLDGPIVSELLGLAVLGPLLCTNLRAPPFLGAVATDASPSGGGVCFAPMQKREWWQCYDLCEESGEHVRLDWSHAPDATKIADIRSAIRGLCASLAWTTVASWKLRFAHHINVLEAEAFLTGLRACVRAGARSCRLLFVVDSRVLLLLLRVGLRRRRLTTFCARLLA